MDGWIDIAVKVGGGAVTLAITAWVLRPARGRARREAGLRHVEYAPAFKALFVVMTAIVVGVGWALATHATFGPDDTKYAVGLGVGAAVILAMFFYIGFVYRIAYDDNFIHLRTLRHWGRRIPWDAVRKVEYRSGWQAWHVKTADAGTIWIYQHLSGHAEFLELAGDKISRAARR
jgi:hypothetical protein